MQAELNQRLRQAPLEDVYEWLLEQPPPEHAASHSRWLGQMALALDKPAAAVGHLENAILANPRDFGSRLDLTLA